jgi:ubiquinone/menaquinone biosynthesis C-methylase UbiE
VNPSAVRLGARLHLSIRRRMFGFDALLQHAPHTGTLIDLGCGHGWFAGMLAQARPGCQVIGFDPDEARVDEAREMAIARGLGNLRFEVGTAERVSLPPAAMVSVIDVLYLLSPADQESVVATAARALEPGGQLLVKEMGSRPRWKHTWNRLQETLAVRVLRLTASERRRFHFRDEQEWAALMQTAGLRVDIERLDAGYLHPHVLVRGTR